MTATDRPQPDPGDRYDGVDITPELMMDEAQRLDDTPATGAASWIMGEVAVLLRRAAHRLRVAEQAKVQAEAEAADARLDAEGWERTAKAAEAERDETLVPAVVRLTDENHALVADRDRLAARVETLEDAIREFNTAYEDGEHDNPTAVRLSKASAALRALVAPDTPTSPTDTGDPT